MKVCAQCFRYAPVAVTAVLLCAFLSCSPASVALKVQTDRPEFALLAERYQAEPGNPPIEIEFAAKPGDVSGSGFKPDLIISSGLYNLDSLGYLSSQKSLLENPSFDASNFYPFTFIGTKDDFRLTVLSWDLPAIISAVPETNEDFAEGVLIPLDNLREKGAQFNTKKRGSLNALGFSPLYSDDFMYLVCQYQGAQLSGDFRGFPTWHDEGINSAIQYLSSWSAAINSGVENETGFLSKYCYDPVYQLLNSKRFSFAYSSASDFLRQPAIVQKKLRLHWPSWQDRVRILDNFVAAGIPSQSSRKADALKLIEWLLSEEVQMSAVGLSMETGAYQFGYLGGFSTRRAITEKIIPLHYPPVRLRIPPENQLTFPDLIGIRWENFKKGTFSPWLRQRITAAAGTTGLKDASNQWLLHMGFNP